MTSESLKFEVTQLRMRNAIKTIESILILVLSLFVSLLLPTLLIRYVYAGQQLFEQPKALEYIPMVAFVVGVGYFLFAAVTNLLREMKAQKLEKDIAALGDDCGCACSHNDMDLGMEMSLAEVMEKRENKAKKVSKKK